MHDLTLQRVLCEQTLAAFFRFFLLAKVPYKIIPFQKKLCSWNDFTTDYPFKNDAHFGNYYPKIATPFCPSKWLLNLNIMEIVT